MTVAKIVEISSESTKSFEDAIRTGITRAQETLKNVKGAWIGDQKVVIEDGKPVLFRVDMKVSFVLM
ncbi:MAG: dodecin family protein [Sinimarinibacterium sp.]|jgi:hypothetical protein